MADIEMSKRVTGAAKKSKEIEKIILRQSEEFCVYDITSEIVDRSNMRRFYRIYARVNRTVRRLVGEDKVKIVGTKESNAPIKKKVYRVK